MPLCSLLLRSPSLLRSLSVSPFVYPLFPSFFLRFSSAASPLLPVHSFFALSWPLFFHLSSCHVLDIRSLLSEMSCCCCVYFLLSLSFCSSGRTSLSGKEGIKQCSPRLCSLPLLLCSLQPYLSAPLWPLSLRFLTFCSLAFTPHSSPTMLAFAPH